MSGNKLSVRQSFWSGWLRKFVIVWTSCMLVLLSGCWDLRYLDKLGVVLAIGIDDDPSGNSKMQITVQVVLPQNVAAESKGGLGGTAVTTVTDTGDTLFEAIRKMANKTSRRLFFSHTQMLIIGEGIAKQGIYPLLDLIERNPDIRTDILVSIARDVTAQQILQTTTQMESIPTNQIHDMLINYQNAYAMDYAVYVKDLVRIAGTGTQQIVLPSIKIVGDQKTGSTMENVNSIPPETYPVMSTMAVFRDGKLIGFLKPKESRGLSWLEEKVQSTVIKLACPNSVGYLMVEVRDTSNRYKVKKTKDGKPVVQINLALEGSIQEITCPDLRVRDETLLILVGDLTSQVVKEELKATIHKLQKEYKTDALGWGKEIYMQQPALWKKIEADWKTIFPIVQYEVICTTKITGTGIRSKSIAK